MKQINIRNTSFLYFQIIKCFLFNFHFMSLNFILLLHFHFSTFEKWLPSNTTINRTAAVWHSGLFIVRLKISFFVYYDQFEMTILKSSAHFGILHLRDSLTLRNMRNHCIFIFGHLTKLLFTIMCNHRIFYIWTTFWWYHRVRATTLNLRIFCNVTICLYYYYSHWGWLHLRSKRMFIFFTNLYIV